MIIEGSAIILAAESRERKVLVRLFRILYVLAASRGLLLSDGMISHSHVFVGRAWFTTAAPGPGFSTNIASADSLVNDPSEPRKSVVFPGQVLRRKKTPWGGMYNGILLEGVRIAETRREWFKRT